MWDHNKWSFQLYAKLIVAFIILFVSKLLRLVAEISMERKMKSQKSKTKSSEGKKQQLSSVRVIQRNLVYIVGLPLNLGDEDVLSLSLHLSVSLSPYVFSHFYRTCSEYGDDNVLQLLQRREYFGQYGKVLKVSMSRTAAGVIQQFPNNTCSV